MNQEDPEARIAELERQLAEQKQVAAPEHQHQRPAFSEASRSQGAYNRDEVDAFLDRVEAALRDPAAIGGVTPADIHNVSFSEPPIGQRGYNEVEVDVFLDRVKNELTRRAGQGPEQPNRCLLYRYGGWDPTTPVLAIDVDKDVIRVIDLDSNALIASGSLAQVTAAPAQHGGIPVLVVGGPGMQAMAIAPHPPPGEWRKRPKSKRPDYLAVDADWLTLAEAFGFASDLAEESTPQNFFEHVLRYFEELGPHTPTTWRTPLVFGALVLVPGLIYWIPIALVVSVILLILAGLFWRFGWEL